MEVTMIFPFNIRNKFGKFAGLNKATRFPGLLAESNLMEFYPRAKLLDIRGYHPSDIPKFSNLTSTTISPCLKFNLRWERWLLMKKWNNYLFITRTRKHSKKKCYEANCKLFVKNSFHARWKIFGWSLFCAKTCLYSCPWTLSVRTVEQIMSTDKYLCIFSRQI